jgi:prepilin-type processing-associated H-X9-DG protein
MNALVGDAGIFSTNGNNSNDPNYRQFFRLTQIMRPTEIFVFLDEHPDTIDDGYFVNKEGTSVAANDSYGNGGGSVTYAEWTDLPATYHNRSTAFSFADGHASLHHWGGSAILVPNQPYALTVSVPVSSATPSGQKDLADFQWVMDHMSMEN